MEFFARAAELQSLESRLPTARAQQRLPLLIALAWQLRQRDTPRALALLEEVPELLTCCDLPQLQHKQSVLRMELIRGETKWLFAELDEANQLASRALQGFIELGDKTGQADAHWLLAMVASNQGQQVQRDEHLERMIGVISGIDPVRSLTALAALALFAVMRDQTEISAGWEEEFCSNPGSMHPATSCWMHDFLGLVAKLNNDFAGSIQHRIAAFHAARECGQIRRAILAATNIGSGFNNLNEFHTALEWMQQGMDLARECNWPGSIGNALTQTAETLRLLHRFDAARDLLREALDTMQGLNASRNYAIALHYLANLELDCQDYAMALRTYQLLGQRAISLEQRDLQAAALCGQARALFCLGQFDAALQAAHAVLKIHKSMVYDKMTALRVIADVHAQQTPSSTPDHASLSPALHYLHQALELASSIEGFVMPPDLLDNLAQEYARSQHFQSAFIYARQANLAREKIHSQDANKRAVALQIKHETEKMQLEAAHLRQLADAKAQRAQVLQQTSETLQHLGQVGQEITAHLNRRKAFGALYRHLPHLLDAPIVQVYLLQADGKTLNLAVGVVQGRRQPGFQLSMDSNALPVRCIVEKREILLDVDPELDNYELLPVSDLPGSALFAPLSLADKTFGAMVVQSFQRNAYGTREQMIFRTLCAYVAIALSNTQAHQDLAETHLRLQQTQQQLVQQEKMASLGMLTTGVANEINNPGNFAHVAAQNLRVDIAEFAQFVSELVEADEAPEVLEAFATRFAQLRDHVTTILYGTERVKAIVRDLRAFSRLDEAEKKTVHLSQCLLSTLNLVRTSWLQQVEFVSEFIDDPAYECWPSLLNQVFMNLAVNACQAIAKKIAEHADQDVLSRFHGEVRVRMAIVDAQLQISFNDNGIGMSSELQARVLEPFFTTKTVGEGTGLGLSIAYGIVRKHAGQLLIQSQPGIGSCFAVCLPLPGA